MLRLRRPLGLLACGLLLAWQPTVFAQDIDALERTLQDAARAAIPRTVLVRAFVADGRMGAGSGAIISPDGLILTCSHVIEIGERIEVATADGTTYPARVVGKNERQDFALVKIEAEGLPTFPLGDSDTVQLGDWVMALGHPGGPYGDLQPAFAAGKVRGLHRKLPVGLMSKYYNDAIMTDVPIFAGDSGGPLVNLKGELVGINGAIVMINEMAFAVPLNQIMADLDALKAGQVVAGVPAGPEAWKDMQDIVAPEDYQRMMQRAMKNLPKLFGGEDSPFGKLFGEDSPLKDLLGGENGEMPDLSELFGGGGGGGEMPDLSELFGGGGEMPDLSKLFGEDSPLKDMFGGEMPDLSKLFGGGGGDPEQLREMLEKMMGGGGDPFGNGAEEPEAPDLQPERAPAPGARPGVMGVRAAQGQGELPGVLIDVVTPGGPAEKAGLKRGDLILSIDGRPTPNFDALKQAMTGKTAGARVQVVVQRASFVDTALVQEQRTLTITLVAAQ